MKVASLMYLCCYLHIRRICATELPKYVHTCKRNDPDLSSCWQRSIELLQPHLKEKGIPELQVPALQPLHIDRIVLSQGNSSSVQFNAVLRNLTFDGTGDFTISDTKVDLDALIVHTVMHFRRWVMNGHYTANGRVLLFQFDSDGKVQGDFGGLTATGTWYLTTYEKKGRKHLKIDKDHIDVTVKKIYIHFDDLFKDNKELTENVNNAIMNNIDLIFDDLQPILSTTIEAVFREYSNRVYDLVPFDLLYPE